MAQEYGAARRTQSNRPGRYRRTRSRTLLFTLVILLVAGAALGLYTLVIKKRDATVSMTPIPVPLNATYLNTGDGLLYQTDGQIHFYHLTDSRKSYVYGTAASDIRMAGSSAMTAVYNDASLQIIKRDTPLTFSGRILALECGQSHIAVLRQDEAGKESVTVFTVNGDQVGEPLAFEDQYIVDFGFYSVSGEMVWVETVNIRSSTPTTMITVYDVTKRATTGVMQLQSQLVDRLYFTSNSVFVAGTNQIIRYAHDGNQELYRYTVYGYRVLDYTNPGTPTFLMTPRGGDLHSVRIVTLEEGAIANPVETFLQLPAEGVTAFLMNGRLVVVSRENLYTYSLKGKLSSTAAFEQPIDGAVKLTESMLLLSSNGAYYIATV